jgi:hypothetical protein
MTEDKSQFIRKFNQIELEQMKELKTFYINSNATSVEKWNVIRDEAKKIWDEKIISAVDGLRKWLQCLDKSSKVSGIYMTLKF